MKKKRILLGIALTAASIFALSTVTSCNNTSDNSGDTETDKVTIKFNTNGGSKIADQKVDKGGTITKPEDPTKANCEFKGWYKEASCTNEWDFTKSVNEDRTLYAKWEEADVVEGLSLTGTYKTRFKKGDTFDATGLVVTENHSVDSDVALDASKYTISLEKEDGTPVDKTQAFSEVGFYSAVVKAGDVQAKYDFKVTAKAETLVDFSYSPDSYGTLINKTTANDSLAADTQIASLAEGKITLTATGAKTKYQQVDSNNNSVGTTYNSVDYGSRMQVNTGADGAIQLYVASDAQVTLYAKGDIGRGIKIFNVDTTKGEKDPKACEFVEEDGNKEVMREFNYYLNAGTYYINSTSGGGVNIYNFIISLYEPTFDPTAPITDLEFSGQRTKFYEMDKIGGITLDEIVDGIVIKSTRDEVGGNAVNNADATFALYKGDTQVTQFSDTGDYSVKVTVEGYTKAYTVKYYNAKTFELVTPYPTITVKKDGTLPILGTAKLTYDKDAKLYEYLAADSSYVTVKYYTTKGTDPDNNNKTIYTGEIADEATALGTVGTVYAEVTFNDALLPLSCLSDTEAANVKTIYFEVNVAEQAPTYWNCHLVTKVNENSLQKGSKQDLPVTNETLIEGVTVDTGTYKSDDSLDCIGIELAKKSGGLISFVVPTGKKATIKINAGSTNATNATDNIYLKLGDDVVAGTKSGAGVEDGATANTFKITGTSTDSILTYSNLAAGTYKFGTAETGRGMRVFSIEITLVDA